MTQVQRALVVLLVATIGIWGCAQGTGGTAEKVRSLETKINRLEEDFRAAAAARDQFRKKLTEAEQATAQLRLEFDALQKDREELRTQLKTRTAERDSVTAQFDVFRKSLKELIGQTEAAMSKPAVPPVTTVSQTKGPNL